MKRLVLLLCLLALPALAADDQATIANLQVALQVCQVQRNEAQDATLNKITPLVVEIERLRKELEAARAKK